MGIYFLPGPLIPAGQALSNAVDCGGHQILRIVCPDQWTAACLTFQLSPDNVKFYDLFSIQAITGGFNPYEAVVPSVPTGATLAMPPATGSRLFWLRFRSGLRSMPVPQEADRMFSVVLWVEGTAASREGAKDHETQKHAGLR